MKHHFTTLLAAALIAAACAGDAPELEGNALSTALAAHAPVYVDSVFPIDEELRRFRAAIEDAPATLGGEWRSRDALVASFMERLEAADTSAFPPMLITRAEFAYLYYPYTRYVDRPYELSPALVWFNMTNATSKGMSRALRLAGRDLRFEGYGCDDQPEIAGEAKIWTGCRVSIRPDGEERMNTTLFGAIIERDGRFKFLSYGNAL
jgi:hypothetical protein